MSSLHGNGDSLIESVQVTSDINTSRFNHTAGQINSTDESISSEWRAKEKLLSWTRQAFGIKPRNKGLPDNSEVVRTFLFLYYLSIQRTSTTFYLLWFYT